MHARSLALAALVAWSLSLVPSQEAPAPAPPAWEYKVVGLVDRHGKTLDYLKRAVDEGRGVLGVAREVDAEIARKTEDLLNELGAEGWKLAHLSETALILERPRR